MLLDPIGRWNEELKRISVLGATGSIGDSTDRVLQMYPDRFRVVLISARSSWQKLAGLIRRYRPEFAILEDETAFCKLEKEGPFRGTHIACGQDALLQAIADVGADITVSAMVGAAGLRPTMAAIRSGSDLALANKESMVVAGSFVNRAAIEEGIALIPVDSEHNALHQCLVGGKREEVHRLILTASGGPFRTFFGDFSSISPAQALKHPTWAMGPKITIDSSTLMNKGLEVIEAHQLFGFGPDQIHVVVHPQSIVHSMVEYRDGSILAQMGKTDMCHPIQYALSYPERWTNEQHHFSFSETLDLHFEAVDHERFPCLQLAYEALQNPSSMPVVLNAANEVAVDGFLNGQIKYTQIYQIVSQTMQHFEGETVNELDEIFVLDQRARERASMNLK